VVILGLEIFAERAKELRKSQRMSTRALGAKIGMSHVVISYYENCKREPTLSVIKAYSKLFGVTTDYLIGVSDNKLRKE
jgi:transcriptional regulator with XRE-family HTH domain